MSGTPHPPGRRTAMVGANVRARREALGLTQSELAERLGWTQNVVAKLELGRTNHRIGQLIDLAWGLGTTPAALLAGADSVAEDGRPLGPSPAARAS